MEEEEGTNTPCVYVGGLVPVLGEVLVLVLGCANGGFGGNFNVNLNINSNNNVVLRAVVSYSSLLVQIQYVFSTSNFILMWQDE